MSRTRQTTAVLDASVILAVVLGEPGGELTDDQCERAVVSVVNTIEVEAKLLERGLPEGELDGLWAMLGIRVAAISPSIVRTAALLVRQHRRAGLSLGDCCCLATGVELSLPVLTADRAWGQLVDLGVEVRVVR